MVSSDTNPVSFRKKGNQLSPNNFLLVFRRYLRRMKLGTGNTITLIGGTVDIWYYRITLDINKQRMDCLKYTRQTRLSGVISNDYDREDKKNFGKSQNLNEWILGVRDNSIFVMTSDEARTVIINENDSNLFRKITIEKSKYFDLIVFNNNFNRTSGK